MQSKGGGAGFRDCCVGCDRAGSGGGDEDEMQVVVEVLKNDMEGRSITIERYSRELYRTSRLLVGYEQIFMSPHHIRNINQAHLEYSVASVHIVLNEHHVGAMTVTIQGEDLTENGTVEDAVDTDAYVHLVLREGIPVHIVKVHHRHSLIA